MARPTLTRSARSWAWTPRRLPVRLTSWSSATCSKRRPSSVPATRGARRRSRLRRSVVPSRQRLSSYPSGCRQRPRRRYRSRCVPTSSRTAVVTTAPRTMVRSAVAAAAKGRPTHCVPLFAREPTSVACPRPSARPVPSEPARTAPTSPAAQASRLVTRPRVVATSPHEPDGSGWNLARRLYRAGWDAVPREVVVIPSAGLSGSARRPSRSGR